MDTEKHLTKIQHLSLIRKQIKNFNRLEAQGDFLNQIKGNLPAVNIFFQKCFKN